MRFALACLGLWGMAAAVPSLACSCAYPMPQRQLAAAGVVFAGIVQEITVVDGPGRYEQRVVVRFRVGRVWKGKVGAEFTMHTFIERSSCRGLGYNLAQQGAELLVFANPDTGSSWKNPDAPLTPEELKEIAGRPGYMRKVVRQDALDAVRDDATIYTTSLCSGTTRWIHGEKIARSLGPYHVPKGGYAMTAVPVDDSRPELEPLPKSCEVLNGAGDWVELAQPPADVDALERELATERGYAYPADGKLTLKDRWLHDGDHTLALCRAPPGGGEACGAAAALFVSYAGKRGREWHKVFMRSVSCD